MSLNKKVMDEYESETGRKAIYNSSGITRHFLPYVDWLEERLLKVGTQNIDALKRAYNHGARFKGSEDGFGDFMLRESRL